MYIIGVSPTVSVFSTNEKPQKKLAAKTAVPPVSSGGSQSGSEKFTAQHEQIN